jgi:hypothetical protein
LVTTLWLLFVLASQQEVPVNSIDTTAVTALWLIYVLASQQEVQVEQST